MSRSSKILRKASLTYQVPIDRLSSERKEAQQQSGGADSQDSEP
jgi:hypothetical protein